MIASQTVATKTSQTPLLHQWISVSAVAVMLIGKRFFLLHTQDSPQYTLKCTPVALHNLKVISKCGCGQLRILLCRTFFCIAIRSNCTQPCYSDIVYTTQHHYNNNDLRQLRILHNTIIIQHVLSTTCTVNQNVCQQQLQHVMLYFLKPTTYQWMVEKRVKYLPQSQKSVIN